MSEIWDLVDKDGRKLNMTWPRADHDNMPEGVYHPCVEIWVKIRDRLLITQRHPDKTEGLKYEVPGGAVVSGESMTLGAVRELLEEVGIAVGEGELISLGYLSCGKVYAGSYLVELCDMPKLSLQASEVVGYKLVDKSELESMFDCLTKGTYRRYLVYRDKIFG